jgi:hypothetical protein
MALKRQSHKAGEICIMGGYSLPDIISMKWVGHVTGIGKKYTERFGKKTRGPPGKLRYIKDDDIKMDLKVTEWERVDWIHLDQDMDK